MNRRQLLFGSGAALGGASILGSGAFTSVAASRDVTVAVADDADAFLRLAPCDSPNGEYVDNSGGVLSIDLSGDNSNDPPSGDGVTPQGVSRFDDVFEIANQGTQNVCVDFEIEVPTVPGPVPDRYNFERGDPAVVFYRGSNRERFVVNNRLNPDTDGAIRLPIDNGNAECIGFEVRAFGFDSGEDLFDGLDLTIRADADADCSIPDAGDVADSVPTVPGPTEGLSNYWPLEDLETERAADVFGGESGTVSDGVSSTDGQVGPAAQFDGSSGVITTDANPGGAGESLTVAGWLKAPEQDFSRNHFFLSNYIDKSKSGFFAIGSSDGDEMYFWVRDTSQNGNELSATGPAFDDQWHHYVGVHDAGSEEIRFYIDGQQKSTGEFSGDVEIRDNDSRFGMMRHFGSRHIEGSVYDVRLYSRALSDGEVEQLFEATGGK